MIVIASLLVLLKSVANSGPLSLINSVDFHPAGDLLCVTYTHANEIVLYSRDLEVVKVFKNPEARLGCPASAVFTPDGKGMVVANWCSQTLATYDLNGFAPSHEIPFPKPLSHCRPHGMSFSSNGELAIAFGAGYYDPKAIAILRGDQWLRYIVDPEPGIPKGITFHGSSLFVTFADTNQVVMYDSETLLPLESIQSPKISRPEDVKISPDGKLCVVSNSDRQSLAFLSLSDGSVTTVRTEFSFPHGIAFSPDGKLLAVTQFGPVLVQEDGGITWPSYAKPSMANVSLYRIDNQ